MASADAAKETCEDGEDTAVSEVCHSFRTALEVLPSWEAPAAAEATDINPASTSSNQYYSARIQWMIENRDKFSSWVDLEIECSKVHQTSVQRGRRCVQEGEGSEWSSWDEDEDEEEDERELDEEILQANREAITDLRMHRVWWHRFRAWEDGVYEIREKIGEGGQATIYAGICTNVEEGGWGRHVVFKVFKRGYYLRDLVKQWPMNSSSFDLEGWATFVEHVMLMPNDGRIAMVMQREWGDLRRLIDMKKQANNNQGPPFDIIKIVELMRQIALIMRVLHERDVVHRDLKASNVLLHASKDNRTAWESNVANVELSLLGEPGDLPKVSDFECALGVMGTGFWRAPEVLLGIRDCSKKCSLRALVTKASDVYSYGMLCYEIATGFLPFEREGYVGTKVEQDRVIRGERPTFPDDVDCRVKDLITRCWEEDESRRPTFREIEITILDVDLKMKFM